MTNENIVLVTLDSLRADHCGFLGYQRDTTPNLDSMATNGISFENAMAPGGGTPAAMTGVLTGEFSSVSPTQIEPAPWVKMLDDRRTISEVLSTEGYSTAAVTPNVFASSYFGFDQGFDYFEDFLSIQSETTGAYQKLLDKTTVSGRGGVASTLRNLRNLIFQEEVFKPWEDYFETITSWVEEQDGPFFLWVLLLDTHHPYLAPRNHRQWSSTYEMWRANWKVLKSNWNPDFSEKERQNLINAYDDSIRYADQFLGRLRDEFGEYDPLIIVHGDHGEAFGEPGWYGHPPELTEETLHVPLVMFDDRLQDTVQHPVSLTGLAEEIAKYAGIDTTFPNGSLVESSRNYAISNVYDGNCRKMSLRTTDARYTKEGSKSELNYLGEEHKDPGQSDKEVETNRYESILHDYLSHENEIGHIRSEIREMDNI
ncbi:sulfatase [Halobellus sp. EA9]|uniref:sulfatase n=1 Tax=Halobellus sp. EA9 TaxID=3421647 RepID=UPI003EBCB410